MNMCLEKYGVDTQLAIPTDFKSRTILVQWLKIHFSGYLIVVLEKDVIMRSPREPCGTRITGVDMQPLHWRTPHASSVFPSTACLCGHVFYVHKCRYRCLS